MFNHLQCVDDSFRAQSATELMYYAMLVMYTPRHIHRQLCANLCTYITDLFRYFMKIHFHFLNKTQN